MENRDINTPELIKQIFSTSIEQRIITTKRLAKLAKDGQLDIQLLHPLLKGLKDPEIKVRLAIGETLGWLAHKCGVRNENMLNPALEMLNDDVAMLRHDGAWILESLALNGIIDQKCIDPLIQNLSYKNNHVKAASAYALGTLSKQGAKENRIFDALQNLKNYNDEGVQEAIKTALATYNGD
jgi:HEAT repeat protein